MNGILDCSHYRDAIALLMSQYPSEKRGLQTRLAEHVGCQQAYLSRVIAGAAELSQEQALAAATFFDLDQVECEYFLTLLNFNRAASPELKAFYQQRRDSILTRRLEIKSRIRADGKLSAEAKTTYYSDWSYAAIHMLTAIDGYRKPSAIASRLGLSTQSVNSVLEFLEAQGLVQKKSGSYINKISTVHLGNENSLIRSHHANWRLRSLATASQGNVDDIRYSSVISCSRKDIVKIKEVFVKAIQQARDIIRDSPSEEIYCYNIDFFQI